MTKERNVGGERGERGNVILGVEENQRTGEGEVGKCQSPEALEHRVGVGGR